MNSDAGITNVPPFPSEYRASGLLLRVMFLPSQMVSVVIGIRFGESPTMMRSMGGGGHHRSARPPPLACGGSVAARRNTRVLLVATCIISIPLADGASFE